MASKCIIGIISYLPSELELRSKRIKVHVKQCLRLNDLYPEFDVVQIDQGYEPADVDTFNSVLVNGNRSVKHEMYDKLGTSKARNVLLNMFYNSSYEYMLLMDDDTLIYPYYNASMFFDDLLNFKDRSEIGMIRPLVPLMKPFKRDNYKEKDVIYNYWILGSSLGINPSGMVVLSNIKKNFGKEVYFNESMNGSGNGYEDYDFVLTLRELGIPTYTCKQLIVNPMLPDNSVTFQNTEERKCNHVKNLCSTYSNHPKLRIQYQVVDGKVKSNLLKLNTWKSLYIPRSVPYDIPSNLVPKNLPSKNSLVKRRKLI